MFNLYLTTPSAFLLHAINMGNILPIFSEMIS